MLHTITVLSVLLSIFIANPVIAAENLERVPGTKISMIPPSGFVKAKQFPGFIQESTGSSIMVTEIEGPFPQIAGSFSNEEELAKRGMKLLGSEQVEVEKQKALLIKVSQVAENTPFLKWGLVFGSEVKTGLIMGAFPAEQESRLSQKMKKSVLTARWTEPEKLPLSKDVGSEGLFFNIKPEPPLKMATRLGNNLCYSVNGVFPIDSIDEPILIVGPSYSEIAAQNLEEFARKRVQQIAGVKETVITQCKPIRIDELKGFEILEDGKDEKSAKPVRVYNVILFEKRNYYLIVGLISAAKEPDFFPLFKKSAQSFVRTGR